MNDIRRYVPELPTFRFSTHFSEAGYDPMQDYECIAYKREGSEYFCKTELGTEVIIVRESHPDLFTVRQFGKIDFISQRTYEELYEDYEIRCKQYEKVDVGTIIPVINPPNTISITPNANIIMKNIQVKYEGYDPNLIFIEGRAYVNVINEGGHNSCTIDLSDLLNWFRINTPDILK